MATLTGNANDTVCSTTSKDTASPGSGNDLVHAEAGNESGNIDARAGGDIFTYRLAGNTAASDVHIADDYYADLEAVQRNVRCWAFSPSSSAK